MEVKPVNDNILNMDNFHFTKFHIFLNYDFSERDRWLYKIDHTDDLRFNVDYESHRIHLFYTQINDSITNGGLKDFIKRCQRRCRRDVIIHVPKRHPEIKKAIEDALENVPNWKMVFEKNSNVNIFWAGKIYTIDSIALAFNNDKSKRCYMYIAYLMDDKLKFGYTDVH